MAKFNVIFLGDRRISQGALSVLFSDEFAKDFCLKAIVTDQNLYRLAQRQRILPEGIPYISNSARNTASILKVIGDNSVNLLLSVQHRWILPGEILKAVGGQAFNLHNSALPDYKGYNSISHAIIDGVAEFRTTIHWMADEVDSGDIAFERAINIADTDTSQSLYVKSVDAAVDIFHDLLKSIAGGETPRIPMKGDGVFYRRDSLERLKDLTGINDSVVLDRVIRASYFPPLAPAYKMINGRKYYLVPAGGYADLTSTTMAANQPQA
jgi:methionyl-tRNA formyltransferase